MGQDRTDGTHGTNRIDGICGRGSEAAAAVGEDFGDDEGDGDEGEEGEEGNEATRGEADEEAGGGGVPAGVGCRGREKWGEGVDVGDGEVVHGGSEGGMVMECDEC
jgi:hypothetical protein